MKYMRRLYCWGRFVATLGVAGHDWLELSEGRRLCRFCEKLEDPC